MALRTVLVLSLPIFAADTLIPKRGGTLRLAIDNDPRSLDPAVLITQRDAMLASFVFNTLLDPAEEGGFTPVLAESLPMVSPDGLTLTVRLRRGVRFSNGREVTANDVVYTFARLIDPKTASPGAGSFNNIRGARAFKRAREDEAASPVVATAQQPQRWIEPVTVAGLRATDRSTFELRLEQPDLASVFMLASPNAAIVPRGGVERTGRGFGIQPVGTGPFVLKAWKRGMSMRFERNPDYFRAGQPWLDGVEIIMNVDGTTLSMLFQRGEIDFQNDFTGPDLCAIARTRVSGRCSRPSREPVPPSSFSTANCRRSPTSWCGKP